MFYYLYFISFSDDVRTAQIYLALGAKCTDRRPKWFLLFWMNAIKFIFITFLWHWYVSCGTCRIIANVSSVRICVLDFDHKHQSAKKNTIVFSPSGQIYIEMQYLKKVVTAHIIIHVFSSLWRKWQFHKLFMLIPNTISCINKSSAKPLFILRYCSRFINCMHTFMMDSIWIVHIAYDTLRIAGHCTGRL